MPPIRHSAAEKSLIVLGLLDTLQLGTVWLRNPFGGLPCGINYEIFMGRNSRLSVNLRKFVPTKYLILLHPRKLVPTKCPKNQSAKISSCKIKYLQGSEVEMQGFQHISRNGFPIGSHWAH